MLFAMPQKVIASALGWVALFFSSIPSIAAFASGLLEGDLNADSVIDLQDEHLLGRYLQGEVLLSEEQIRRADIDGDGQVDAQDDALLRARLGIAGAVPHPLLQVGIRSGGSQGTPFLLGVSTLALIPDWVRGSWQFTSTVIEDHGFGTLGSYQSERISLPGDLAGLYAGYRVDTGERLERVCWQVEENTRNHFVFSEHLRDHEGSLIASTADITRHAPGEATIRIRTEVLKSSPVVAIDLSVLLAMGTHAGDFNVRTGAMQRIAGTESSTDEEALAQPLCTEGR